MAGAGIERKTTTGQGEPGGARKPVGRNAAALKYDLLSAMGVHACAGDKFRQRLILRLMTLIVARYNWIADEISVGQREMAALWGIDERSVKRELARLREMGWLVVKRPAARGRVAVHGLDLATILETTRPDWERVGPDFAQRMQAPEATPPKGNVISFPAPRQGDGLWPQLQALLHREDPHAYGAWFAALECEAAEAGVLRLLAPSRFHADYLRANHLHRLERLTERLSGVPLRVEIGVSG